MAGKLSCIVGVVFAVLVSGCAAPTLIKIQAPFNPAEAKALLEPGTNTITGSALLRQVGGGVVTCAGNTVTLVPGTAYAQERVRAVFGSSERAFGRSFAGYQFENDPPEYPEIMRKTRCDPQGKFTFKNVADGTFFVLTSVTWRVRGEYLPEGGSLMERVTVKGGESVELILSP